MQVVDGALRICCRREDGALVVAQNLQPAIEIACVVGARFELWDDAEIGAEKRAAEFGNELFPSAFAPVFRVAAEIAIKSSRCGGPVRDLVAEDGDIGGIVPEGIQAWHLDVITLSGIIGSRSSVSDQRAGIGKEAAGIADAAHRILDRCDVVKAAIKTGDLNAAVYDRGYRTHQQ
uniref:Uncharacterized protein n=1 Tax=Rhizobium leguminosarum TaxID=384 RepID=A0A154IIX8_RHILE|nr:hypothetical protein A4A59_02310 [Rhizobium leguminosarum]